MYNNSIVTAPGWFIIIFFNIFKKVIIKAVTYLGGGIIRFNIKNLGLKYHARAAGLLDNNNTVYIKSYLCESRFRLL